jgi:WD40 repeat protein
VAIGYSQADKINLALLEHALGQLWDSNLTSSAYEKIGRLKGALGRHADNVIAGIGDDGDRKLTQRIFLELVQLGEGAQDTRRRVTKQSLYDLGDASTVENLIELLTSKRLIATSGDSKDSFVEVSHEALIREWSKLREWLLENRDNIKLERRLLEYAIEWERLGEESSVLLRGPSLGQAEDWLSKHARAQSQLRRFIEASIREKKDSHERELARERAIAIRFRRFSYVLIGLLVMALGAGWSARIQQLTSDSRALAARAEVALGINDIGGALQLANQALRIKRTSEAQYALTHPFAAPVASFGNETAPLTAAEFSPDAKSIVAFGVNKDNDVGIWDSSTGKRIANLVGHNDIVFYSTFSPDNQRVVTASRDGTARVWDAASGKALLKLESGSSAVMHAEFSPDGKSIVTASYDNTARVWDSADGTLIATLQHPGAVLIASFSPDGRWIVTGCQDAIVRIWNAATSQLIVKLEGHKYYDSHPRFSPDSEQIVTVLDDSSARIWSVATGKPTATITARGVRDADFSPDNQRIVIANDDNNAQIWTTDGKLLFTLKGHTGRLTHARFSPTGQLVITAGEDHVARLWTAANGKLVMTVENNGLGDLDARFSRDGRHFLTAGPPTISVWNTAYGECVHRFPDSGLGSFSNDGERIVTAGRSFTAQVWNAINGQLLVGLKGHSYSVLDAEFSRDRSRVVTASQDTTARIWDTVTGKQLQMISHRGPVGSAEFSPDAQRILTSSGADVFLWNVVDGRLLFELGGNRLSGIGGHTDTVFHAEFSPDGNKIVTSSRDDTAGIWSATNGERLATLKFHSSPNLGGYAEFSPDGRLVVTSGDDYTTLVWTSSGEFLYQLDGHSVGTAHDAVRIKYRRHPDDVIALPLARLSNRVDERNPLLINASCLTVDIGLVVVGIENLQLVSGVAATGRRQKDAAIAARLIGPGDILGDLPFNMELEIVELAFGFDIARAARLAHRHDSIADDPIGRRFITRVHPLVQIPSIEQNDGVGSWRGIDSAGRHDFGHGLPDFRVLRPAPALDAALTGRLLLRKNGSR